MSYSDITDSPYNKLLNDIIEEDEFEPEECAKTCNPYIINYLHYAIANLTLDYSFTLSKQLSLNKFINLKKLDINENNSSIFDLITLEHLTIRNKNGKGFIIIPNTISNLVNLKVLNIFCKIDPGSSFSMCGMNNLKSITLNIYDQNCFPFTKIASLEHLHILDCVVTINLEYLINLRVLYIQKVNYTIEIKGFEFLAKLEFLSTSGNYNIPPEIGRLSNLKILKLIKNEKEFPKTISLLSNLEIFEYGERLDVDVICNLRNLKKMSYQSVLNPDNLFKLDNLDKLDLVMANRNPYTSVKILQLFCCNSVPNNIIQSTNLDTLAIKYLLNCECLKQINQLSKITQLDLSYINIDNLTESIVESLLNLTHLEFLILNSNKLKSLPTNFKNFTNLKSLSLSINEFKEIPLVLCEMTQLIKLHMIRNKISIIRPEFYKLINLVELDLSCNNLTYISPMIGNLCKLQILCIRSNIIEEIPLELYQLTNLKKLKIYVTNKEKEISQLQNLEHIDVMYSRISTHIIKCKKLKAFDESIFVNTTRCEFIKQSINCYMPPNYNKVFNSIINLMDDYVRDTGRKILGKNMTIFNVRLATLVGSVETEIDALEMPGLYGKLANIIDYINEKSIEPEFSYEDAVLHILSLLDGVSPKVDVHDDIKIALK
jgi:Leucine-rich repeat (LRR) protein